VRKRWLTLAAIAVVTVLLASLFAALRGSGTASAAHKATFSACLVTDIGGLNDKSFNHLAYVGLLAAEKQGVKGRVIQSKSSADYIPNLQACVRQGAGITIGVGFLMQDAMDAVATSFPNNKFAIVDVDVTGLKHKPKNVQGLLFKEQEAGYLVGYAAGLWAKAHGGKAVGSVGGIKIPPVDRYIAGFQFAAKKADPGITTLNDYSNDFVVQSKCKEKALNQIAQGSVVEFQVAGQCGLGVLDAAHEKGIFGIGVDADQGYLGNWVMTSALKRVDVAVHSAITAAKVGKLKTGVNAVFGATKNGVGYGKWSSKVPASIRAAVARQYGLLKAGKIKGIPTVVK
jgi:basic membrane protein A and related proteins